jgi:transposase
MAKFSADEKREAVIRYQNGSESFKTVANSIGVHHSVLISWVKQYEHQGEEAFIKCYTPRNVQAKLDVFQYMYDNGTSARETAAN